MSSDPITALLNVGITAISRIWPDPIQQAQEVRKLQELAQNKDLAILESEIKLLLGQIEINKIDAKSSSRFQSWWRPSIGWVGSISLTLMYIPKSIVMTYVWSKQSLIILSSWDGVKPLVMPLFPDLGVTDIVGLLVSLLGIGVMRSADKYNGVDTKK